MNLSAIYAGVANIPVFKTMRTLRGLRPLRAMSRMKNMKVRKRGAGHFFGTRRTVPVAAPQGPVGGRGERAPIINRMNECMPRLLLLLQLILLFLLVTFQGVTNQLHCISPWCWWHSGLQNHENFEGP